MIFFISFLIIKNTFYYKILYNLKFNYIVKKHDVLKL